MTFVIVWTAMDSESSPPYRCEKLALTVNANSEKEAVRWTEDFLGRNTGAPVRALWRLDSVMAISQEGKRTE